jgi:hypothetical protein
VALAKAHLDLARAEADEIKGEVGRAVALGGLAIGVAILLGLFLPIGGMLFLGEWLFGSIGWGLLLGTELLIAVAVTAILVALRVPRLGFDVLLALLVGIAVGLVFALSLSYRLFLWLGDTLAVPTEPGYAAAIIGVIVGAALGLLVGIAGWRSSWSGGSGASGFGMFIVAVVAGAAVGALFGGIIGLLLGAFIWGDVRPRATALIVMGIVGALAGLIAGLRAGRSAGAAIGGLAAGIVVGLILGAILSVDYGPRVGAAFGVAAFLLAWPVLMVLRLRREGINGEELKRRFWPQQTIDTTKERIEWAKERLPLVPKS